MVNVIVIAIIAAAVIFAVRYIIKAKSKGVKCIGCPNADCCSKKNCE